MIIQDVILHGRNNNKPYISRKDMCKTMFININKEYAVFRTNRDGVADLMIEDILADDWECYAEEETE